MRGSDYIVLKRLIAFALVFVLTAPMGLLGKAEALTTSNYTAEPHRFLQSSTAVSTAPAVSGDVIASGSGTSFVPANIYPMPPASSGDNASWAHAAIAALDAAAAKGGLNKEFNLAHMTKAVSRTPASPQGGFNRNADDAGNRAMVTAYLMRGLRGGPLQWDEDISPSTAKPESPVTGIVYIPEATANNIVYRHRIQNAILTNGAVAASLHYNENRLRFMDDEAQEYDHVYDNVTRRNASNVTLTSAVSGAANHTVLIIGWDDDKVIDYTLERTDSDGVPQPLSVSPPPGAFLVQDNNVHGTGEDIYWVSYGTLLSGAYYIEGFFNNDYVSDNSEFDLHTTPTGTDPKNPLGFTYEHDLFGLTGVRSVSGGTAYFANIFDIRESAAALHAVSLFLTGENNNFKIYLVDDLQTSADLRSFNFNTAVPIAEGSKELPGYYTVALKTGGVNKPVIVNGRRFAIVAVVSGGNGAAVPIQSTSLANTASGRSFFSSNGDTWTDAFNQGRSAVCLKAHAEPHINLNLSSVSLPASKDDDDKDLEVEAGKTLPANGGPAPAIAGLPLLNIAPGGTHSLGPILNPANANNVLHSKTIWRAYMPYYERDENGFLIPDDDDDSKTGDQVWGWCVWNTDFGMFMPEGETFTRLSSPAWRNNLIAIPGEDAYAPVTTKPFRDFVPPVIRIANPLNGSSSVAVDRNEDYYDGLFLLEVTVQGAAGRDKDGKLIEADAYERTGRTVIQVEADSFDELRLDRTDHSMRAGASVALKVSFFKDDKQITHARRVQWRVVRAFDPENDNDSDAFSVNPAADDLDPPLFMRYEPFDPRDPFAPGGPIATVNRDGRVTALRDGRCFVYAVIVGNDGEELMQSNPVRITIERRAATGMAISRRKQNMSVGTTMTLSATVRPAAASNKGVDWTATTMDDEETDAIIFRDPSHNPVIFDAVKPGVYKITGTSRATGAKVHCVITVTSGPTSTVRIGRRGTYSVLGSNARSDVKWTLDPAGGGDAFSGEAAGVRYRLTADSPGALSLTGRMMVDLEEPLEAGKFDPDRGETSTSIILREQSWNLHAVVPISRMVFKRGEDVLRNITLGVRRNEDGTFSSVDSSTETLTVEIIRPAEGATVLGFDWTIRQNKRNPRSPVGFVDPGDPGGSPVTQLDVAAPSAGSNTSTITITALSPGSTRITGTNHNGRRRVNISVRVFLYPDASQITLRSSNIVLNEGRSVGVKAKVNGKNMHRELTYSLVNAAGADFTDNGFVTLDASKARLTATAATEDTVWLRVTAAGGEFRDVPITVRERK
jgi:hypothetical protein